MERSQMDEPRSSIPNGYVPIHPGNFAIVKEDFHNREVVKLWVKENDIGDRFIRKYRKQNGRWECCRCVSNKNSRRRSNGNMVHDFKYARIKFAIYNEAANELYVAKAHSPNSCKPYPITREEFQDHLPMYERKPRVRNAVSTSAPIVFEMPNLSSTPPADDRLAFASSFSTHDRLLSASTNILSSPLPQSSQTILYSANPMRSDASATIPPPLPPRVVESLNATVAQELPPSSASTSALPSAGAAATPRAVSTKPTQSTPTAAITSTSTTATVIRQSIPANVVVQRSVDDPNIISASAGNYHGEENAQNNLRERSNVSIPDDPITESIQVKTEAYVSIEANESNPNNDLLGVNANVIDEEIVEIKEDRVSFEPASNKTLKAACKKLNLTTYSQRDALGFWADIEIPSVKPLSNSIESGRKGNGFECLSLLLTGSHENCFELYNKLNMKLESDEEMKARYDLSKRHEMSLKFCDEHLVLLAHWLSCRIGVYEHGVLQKYGNWNSLSQSNDLIILMEKESDLYAPILNL